MVESQQDTYSKLFDDLKREVAALDPVAFAENYMTIDGKPFEMTGNGWKFMADVYRDVAAQATSPNAKPMVILKGRQVGATILAAVLSLYFTASGLYGNAKGRPPIRVLHAFPTLGIMSKYAKDKLAYLIQNSQNGYLSTRSISNDPVISKTAPEDTLTEKTFLGLNKLRVDSVGHDAGRLRGLSQDVLLFDECIVGSTHLEVFGGKRSIKSLYEDFIGNKPVPPIKSFNETTKLFEYKRILNAWDRGVHPIVEVRYGKSKIHCTANHKFLTERGWIKAANLVPGDLMISAPGRKDYARILNSDDAEPIHSHFVVGSVSDLQKVERVFDIEVEDNHNFIVTSRKNSKNLGGPVLSNCQDMSQQAIENALRILTSAQYGPQTQGVQLYFGTPKQAGSYFWDIWNESDQRFYQLCCVKCSHFFFLYTIGNDEWRKIWIEKNIVQCPNCKHRQEKRDAIEGGRWVATKEGKCKYIGYHMNVLLNPIFTKESVLQYDPEMNQNRSRRAWENETMGNFYSTSNLTLSIDELRQICCDQTRRLAKEAVGNSDKIYVMGIDWGDKVESEQETRGKSYTVIVILSINSAGIFTVENAWRLANNDFQYQVNTIEHLFATFKIRTAAADYMWGQQQVNHIQNMLEYGSRFLGCINSGSVNQMLTYKPKETRVVVNKDQMIDELFSLFRKGKIQFPAMGDSFDRIYWLLEHCTSMELTTSQRYGSAIKKYEKGIGPNDGLMAIMYAVIAYKFLATNGFSGTSDRRDGARPMPSLAFLPRMR